MVTLQWNLSGLLWLVVTLPLKQSLQLKLAEDRLLLWITLVTIYYLLHLLVLLKTWHVFHKVVVAVSKKCFMGEKITVDKALTLDWIKSRKMTNYMVKLKNHKGEKNLTKMHSLTLVIKTFLNHWCLIFKITTLMVHSKIK